MLTVLGNKILLTVDEQSTCVQKIGVLNVPVNANDFEIAKVISTGENVSERVTAGSTVYIYKGSGKSILHEGVKYRVITDNEVIVVINKE